MTLTQYEGRDVAQATIRLTNAGDGLSQAMGIDPAEYHHGEKLYLVIEAEVAKVTYDTIRDTDLLARVHTLRAGVSTIVDEAFAKDVLEEQRIALEKAKGVTRLPLANGDDADDRTE